MELITNLTSGTEPQSVEYLDSLGLMILRNKITRNEYQHKDVVRVLYSYDEARYTTDEYCLLKINECGGSNNTPSGPVVDVTEFNNLKKTVTDLQTLVNTLQSKITNMETQTNKISKIENDISQNVTEISNLKSADSHLLNKVSALETKETESTRLINDLKSKDTSLDTDIINLKNKDIELEGMINSIPQP